MRKLVKRLSLILMLVMVLAISFGCANQKTTVEPNTPDDIVNDENPKEDPEENQNSIVIKATDKISKEGMTLIDGYEFDIDGDGNDELIYLYTAAEKDSEGEIIWDDGQNWKLSVEDGDKNYILFDDYVQLGTIRFHAYTKDEDFYITTMQTGTASLKLTEYHFDEESKSFVSKVKFETKGNINLLHSSYGY